MPLVAPLLAAAALALSSASSPAPAPPGPPLGSVAPLQDPAVFAAFHGRAGVERIVADLIAHVQTDPRIADIFKAADLPHLRSELADQVCYLLGGGCGYAGKSMRAAHKDMGLQDADLNALVENLQAAMDREGVPFHAQNRLLAKLAPFRREVVER